MLNILGCSLGGVSLASGGMSVLPAITSLVVTLIKIAVPIILIIFGMLDLMKAVMTNDEKEMKGAQTKLLKRVIYAVSVFLVVSIVQIVFATLSQNTESDIIDGNTIQGCISCFVNGTSNC